MFRKKINNPKLSVIVVFYDMPKQALNTLFTLSTDFQQEVGPDDYEVIAVENRSDNPIDQDALTELKGNFRYFLRDETLPTPVNAINFGVEQALGKQVCIMVDGARMVSPRLIHFSMIAARLYPQAVISVPGYHLGEKLQQEAVSDGYNESVEQELLASVPWREDGYRLFDISCLSGTSRNGYFEPMGESNTLTVPRSLFDAAGGFDTRFTETGGGQCNLDFYKRVVELPETNLVMLMGEGSFHQFHGGVTTGRETGEQRDRTMNEHFAQYREIRGDSYSPPQKTATLLGEVHPSLLKFVHHSAQFSRYKRGEIQPDTKDQE